jgi:Spy/CpxP family protein refolding chaperone
MNKMVHRVLRVAVLAGLVAVALSGVAHPKGEEEGGRMCHPMADQKHQERMVERISDALVLDAPQKLRLATLAQKWHAFQEAEHANTKDQTPRQSMLGLIAGDHLDQKGAQALVEQRVQVLQAQSPEVIKAAAEFFDGLRPEQQQKVRKFLAHGPQMGMGRHGAIPHHGGAEHPDAAAHSQH